MTLSSETNALADALYAWRQRCWMRYHKCNASTLAARHRDVIKEYLGAV